MSAKDFDALTETIRRLEDRLDRERRARERAEAISDQGIRELLDRQRILGLLEAIGAASNQDRPLEDTLRFALVRVCEFMGWAAGHIWWVAHDQDQLYSSGIWQGIEGERRELFRRASIDGPFLRGAGLPGLVLETGEPLWVQDAATEDDCPRRQSAHACGLHAGFAFPVLIGAQTVAVFELFSIDVIGPDAGVLRAMAQVGQALGRAVERKRAEEALYEQVAEAQAARRQAEAASRAKSDFLAVTSHEVRTPLNAVLGLAQALRTEPLTDRQAGLVEGVLDAGTMLLRLLNSVLDVTRIETGKMSLDLAPFDLRLCAGTVVEIWRPRAGEQGVTLGFDLAGLPDDLGVLSDRGKIEQVLINLISNALKFSPAESRIDVRAQGRRLAADRLSVRLEVCDQGPGVAVADRERIFKPFEQTLAGREHGGAGLGLSVCAGHAQLLGGRIGVDEAPGGGARFWVEFETPLAPLAAGLATPEPFADGGPVTSSRSAIRVLAAEDHPANRMVLEALLEPVGVSISFAENGREAVTEAAAFAFDLILMDVNMPVMDGVSALQAIRALGGAAGQTPIHMVTANVFEEDVQRYLACGADGVLKKPIDARELIALVMSVDTSGRASPPGERQHVVDGLVHDAA